MSTTPKDPRVRSWWFVVTGALGGLLGWGATEIAGRFAGDPVGLKAEVLHSAFYFAGFGFAVGAALGLTEGWVLKDRKRLIYGLFIGMILGGVGGWLGGAAGQTLYSLYPHRYLGTARSDLALVLDSSTSMGSLLRSGNDRWGKRRKAARRLIDRLAAKDRVTVIDFDTRATLLLPLTPIAEPAARRTARDSISRIDNHGGTDLVVGIRMALEELTAHPAEGRNRFILFLTDGEQGDGVLNDDVLIAAAGAGIAIHAVGLGEDVDPEVLQRFADRTGGTYYPVARAGDLIDVFDQVYTSSSGAMTEHTAVSTTDDELLTPEWVLLILRGSSWAVVGLLIGLGQGVRENTREDLKACGWGGLLGGALGGVLFQLASPEVGVQAELVGRLAADVLVGAFIGGTMRVAQGVAGTDRRPTTTLLSALPEKSTAVSIRPRTGETR